MTRARRRLASGLLAVCALALWMPLAAGEARAQADPTSRPILPGARQPGEPAPIPSALPPVVYPYPSLQILIGSDFLDVRADDPEIDEHAGTPFSTGAVFGFDFVDEHWRAGYMRRVYRHSLKAGTEFRGRDADIVAINADSLWVHGGLRPWRPLYGGLGLSLQRRRLEFFTVGDEDGGVQDVEETAVAGEALLEYAFALPFAIQARYGRDLNSPRVELNGWTVVIAYTIPL